jgi:hypothetical protein
MKLASHLKNIPDSKLDLKSQPQWSQEISKLSEQYKAEYIQMHNEYRKQM